MSHLKKINENYFKHFTEAIFIVIISISAGIICLIHAFLPNIFQNTSSNLLKYIISRTDKRNDKVV